MIDAFIVATGERSGLSRLAAPGMAILPATLPAPLLPVLDRPVLMWIVEGLARQGVKRMVIAVSEAAGRVEQALGDGKRWDIDIDYVLMREPYGNAGAARWAQRLLPGPFLLLPGDALVDVDVEALFSCHRRQAAALTVLAHGGDTAALRVHGNGQIRSEESELAPTGVYLVEPHVLELAPPRTSFDVHHDLQPAVEAAGLTVAACSHDGYWNPLCSAEQLHQAQLDLLRSVELDPAERLAQRLPRHPQIRGTQIAPGIWVGKHNLIHPLARIMPPVFIGDDCRIGPNVELGPEAVVSSHVIVDEAATIHHSTILPHTYVGRLVDVGRRLLQQQQVMDLASGQTLEVVDEFLLAPAHPASVSHGARRVRDALLGAFLLWLLAPFVLLPALLALLRSGQALQRVPHRVGPAGRTLQLLRLNTRHQDGKPLPLGLLVERWELQRLPELWNVVRGDLALVGLMPLPLEVAEQVDEMWRGTREDSPGGFTGQWFVDTIPGSSLDEALAADALFTATRSWQQELRLLARTPAAWLRRAGARNNADPPLPPE
jgi:NDP-sugar pyrophosphorylase family protein/lipopolysaccharide/colanic/teichoic acid biosynthesis glycosyltransferase